LHRFVMHNKTPGDTPGVSVFSDSGFAWQPEL